MAHINKKDSNKSPTLNDVARIAGLSPITISRVINNPHMVKAATIAKVKEAIAITGYIPNMLAGGLASKKSKLIATAVPQINNTMFVDTMQALSGRLSERGYHMLLCMTGYSLQSEEEFISAILSRRPDGIVLTGINHSPMLKKILLQANIPILEMWDLTPTPLDMLVGFSHKKIGNEIANYLLSKGYKNYALLWADDERAQLRKKGIFDVLQNNGIDTQNIPIYQTVTPATNSAGREGLSELITHNRNIDVVICSSDILAQGVTAEALNRGLKMPHDLAEIGFGDFSFSKYNYPPISTVFIDKVALGRISADMLIDSIEGKAIDNKIVDISFQLKERETT